MRFTIAFLMVILLACAPIMASTSSVTFQGTATVETPDDPAHDSILGQLADIVSRLIGIEAKIDALGEPPAPVSAVTITPIQLNVGDENPSVAGMQIADNRDVVHTADVIDPNQEVTSWTWSYTVDGGAVVPFSSGTSLPVQHAIFPYPAGAQSYVWTLQAKNEEDVVKEQSLIVETHPPATVVIPTLTTAFKESCNGQPNPPGQTDFYVSHTLGTTFEHCRQAVRTFLNGSPPTQPMTVWFEAGRHDLTAKQSLTIEDSGSEAFPITYRSFPGETVILSGSATLNGWSSVTDQAILNRVDAPVRPLLKQASLGTIPVQYPIPVDPQGQWPQNPLINSSHSAFTLTFNKTVMPLARYPNTGMMTLAAPTTTTGSFAYTDPRVARWVNEPDVYVNGFFFWDYASAYGAVKSIDTSNGIIQLKSEAEIPVINGTGYAYHKFGFKAGQPYYALNALSEIDMPGEWYLDRATKIVYFYPPSPIGMDQVEVPVAQYVLLLDQLSWVTFKNLTIEGSTAFAVAVRAATTSSVGLTFDGATMRNSSHDGLSVIGKISQLVVKNGEIYNIGNTGIVISGGNTTTLTPSRHRIENMTIHDVGQSSATAGRAIQMGGVGIHVLHNHIYNVPNIAIQVVGNNHRLAYNDIHDVTTDVGDSGAIYMGRSWADQGNVIEYNYFHDIQPSTTDAVMAIYLDDQESGFTIRGNVFDRVYRGVMLGGGRENHITGNIMVEMGEGPGTGGGGAQLYMDGRGVRGYATQQATLLAKPFTVPPWSAQYPGLPSYLTDQPGLPIGNTFEGNVFSGSGNITVIDHAPGHIDLTNNLTSALDAQYQVLDSALAFQQIPFDFIRQSEGVPPMADILRMDTEAQYDALTGKPVGTGQAQAWDATSSLGGLSGDIKFTLTGVVGAWDYAYKTGVSVGSATSLATRNYINTTNLTQGEGEVVSQLGLLNTGAAFMVGYGLRTSSGTPQIYFGVKPDATALLVNAVNTTKGVHYIDIVVIKASTDSANDGSVTYYLDGVQVAQRTGLDFFNNFAAITRVDMGYSTTFSAIDAGTSGTAYFGKLLITDGSTAIGAYSQHNQLPFNQLRRKRRLS